MKDKILKVSFSLLFTGIIIYLGISFLSATFNPAEMNEFVRGFAVSLWLVLQIPICGVLLEEKML